MLLESQMDLILSRVRSNGLAPFCEILPFAIKSRVNVNMGDLGEVDFFDGVIRTFSFEQMTGFHFHVIGINAVADHLAGFKEKIQ